MVDNKNDEKNYSQMAPNVNINDEDNGDNQKWASAIEGLRKKDMSGLQIEGVARGVALNNKGNQRGGSWQ